MVDKMLNIKIISFDFAIPFIALMIIIILIKETLTIYRKYLTENVATKSEMKLTIKTIKSIFKSPID
jgi:hypothetical protein